MAVSKWDPSEEEVAAIVAEMRPIIERDARRFRAALVDRFTALVDLPDEPGESSLPAAA